MPVFTPSRFSKVILLKKAYEIQPIAIEDIVTFVLPDEIVDSSVSEKPGETTEAVLGDIGIITEKKDFSVKVEIKDKTKPLKKTKSQTEQFNELFHTILEEKDNQIRDVRIVELVKKIIWLINMD